MMIIRSRASQAALRRAHPPPVAPQGVEADRVNRQQGGQGGEAKSEILGLDVGMQMEYVMNGRGETW